MDEKLVLIIEDNPLNMKLVKQLVAIAKHHSIEAFNAEDGIQLARRKKPDLILIDIQLPGMDGLTAVKAIRRDPAISNIPIVALTAHAMRGDELKSKEAGCDDYVSKPIDTKVFFNLMKKYLPEEQVHEKGGFENSMEGKTPQMEHTILIVDDEVLNVKLLAAKLGTLGYRILKAYSGREAINLIEKNMPDLILLDIMMPEMDGYEVIRRLKSNKETENIPIVLITALEGIDEKTKGLAAGADDFLNKPINTTELETRVISLLRMKKYQEQLTARIQAEHNILGNTECIDQSGISGNIPNVLLVEDNPIDSDLISYYFRDMNVNLFTVRTGKKALEMIQREKIDVVLLDLLLPDLNGLDICKKIKENEATMMVQVVIITTLDDLKVKIRGIEQGADDFLLKPLNHDELNARVTALLKKKAFMDRLNERANMALQASITDKLTGVYNHAYFKHFIDLEIKRTKRHKNTMALLMIDVDNFKAFNDMYGHTVGDKALAKLGSVLKENIRDVDVAARYGGEEFAVVLPYTNIETGKHVAERLLGAIKAKPLEISEDETENPRITISIGIAVYPGNGNSSEEVIHAADMFLYEAKNKGKNRVCCPETINEDVSHCGQIGLEVYDGKYRSTISGESK